MADTYTCALCKDTFEKGWSDEEALLELAVVLPVVSAENCKLVCDDCFKTMSFG